MVGRWVMHCGCESFTMTIETVSPDSAWLTESSARLAYTQWCALLPPSGVCAALILPPQPSLHVTPVLSEAQGASWAGERLDDLWPALSPFAIAPVRALLAERAPGTGLRTLRLASQTEPPRWLECSVHDGDTLQSLRLLLLREVTHEMATAMAFQQEKLRAIAYDRIKFNLLAQMLTEQDGSQLLETTAREIEAAHQGMYVAVVLTDALKPLVNTVIAPSLPMPLQHTLAELHLHAGNGSTGTAIANKQRVIVDDVMQHPHWVQHRAAAAASGVQACWSEPILNAQHAVLGAVAVYYTQKQSPSAAEQTLIEQVARLISLVVARQQSQASIHSLTHSEPVTGLPNRKQIYDYLQQPALLAEGQQHWGVIYIDLDHFKRINDAHGQEAGNRLLAQTAQRLRKACAPHRVGCMGGDEFVVLLTGLDAAPEQALKQLWELQRNIKKVFSRPFTLAKQKWPLTASMGLCHFLPSQCQHTDFLKAADIAMHKAKQAGRNQAVAYTPGMQSEITSRVMQEAELREAILKQQLCPYYQVQVDHTGRPFGAELLLRWQHPERGVISPLQFIAVAESSGLIVDIGQRVLDQACAQIARWQKQQSTRELSLSVNISARQFRQHNFVAMVKACIQRHQIIPHALRLELTESMLLENVEDAISIMHALSQLGIQFSLDDFGTGYSSLQYLKKLPLYQLKIDRSFVQDIVSDSHDRTIVRTIIGMAQSLYLGVIAEGVETEDQFQLLLNHGCRRYQGYLFGRPLPAEAFEAYLQTALNVH